MLSVIIDANKLISALLSKRTVFEVFLLNKSSKKINFIAPEFLFFELGRNFGEIIKKTKLTFEEISNIFEIIKEQIELIPFEEFNRYLNEADKLAPHDKDSEYFALALARNCGIWSDEEEFWTKQHKVEILSTGRLLSLFKTNSKN